MKRQKHRARRNDGRTAGALPGAEKPQGAARRQNASSRRRFLMKMANGALVTAVVGGGGWYLVSEVRASIREEDLSRIGNGVPAVVQIHDPQCPQCRALQREARKALAEFSDGELQYLVANIRSPEGRRLANAHGVGHITLLLFDADGQRRDVLVGPNTSERLERAFRQHLARGTS